MSRSATLFGQRLWKLLVVAILIMGGVAGWWFRDHLTWISSADAAHASAARDPDEIPRVVLMNSSPLEMRVPQELFTAGRFRTARVEASPAPEPLRLPGAIVLDPNRLARVHTLFSGHVMRIGLRGDQSKTADQLSDTPEAGLRQWDDVKKGQILAVIWCKDVGEKKSELVDQIAQLRADLKVLERYQSVDPGVVSLNALTQARLAVERDRNAVARAERTLTSWMLTDAEIDAVKREAEKLQDSRTPKDREVERSWAEVAIRAPFDALVAEKNITIGDTVDPTLDLFKLAKLDRLQVLANVYEEDLPKLQQLARSGESSEQISNLASVVGQAAGLPTLWQATKTAEAVIKPPIDPTRAWTIHFQANGAGESEEGCFEKIGHVIDPSQHTGTVHGWVDDHQRKLFIGQYVTATVQLRPDAQLVAVPAKAVVEDRDGPIVFVAIDEPNRVFARRRVAVVVRGREQIYLRREPNPAEARRGAESIHAGDLVLTQGALELTAEGQSQRVEGPQH